MAVIMSQKAQEKGSHTLIYTVYQNWSVHTDFLNRMLIFVDLDRPQRTKLQTLAVDFERSLETQKMVFRKVLALKCHTAAHSLVRAQLLSHLQQTVSTHKFGL